MENLFSKDDMYLYRAVLRFYLGKFRESISDFAESKRVKKVNKLIDN